MKKIFVFLLLFVISCTSVSQFKIYTKTKLFMDTIVTISAADNERQHAVYLINQAMMYMQKLADELDVHNSTNIMYKINTQACRKNVFISSNINIVLKEGLYFSRLSNGYFDITVYPLVQLWDFKKQIIPSQKKIAQTLCYISYSNVILTNNTVKIISQHTEIDTGGIAKGFIIDKGAEFLKQHGIKAGLINAGGDIYAWGRKPDGQQWKVGIQDPRNSSEFVKIVRIKDKAIVTSGDYERYFIKNGVRYHHILNPKTGYPDTDIMSATIIASNAMLADGLSTTVMVMGHKRGLRFLRSDFPNIQYLIICHIKGKRKTFSNF